MKKTDSLKSIAAWSMLAFLCIVVLSFSSQAAEDNAVTGYNGGPGMTYDAEGRAIALEEQFEEGEIADAVTQLPPGEEEAVAAALEAEKAAETGSAGETTTEETADGTIFTHDGVRYKKGSAWGEHQLTGYSAERNGTRTASGMTARPKHTVAASSQLPLGTVLIVEGVSGPNAADYNGVYVVEDRGGAKVEEGLIDIFFQTHGEAAAVTDHGWNTVSVWIAQKAE